MLAETDLIGSGSILGWTVAQLYGFVAAPSLEPVSYAMLRHSALSMRWDDAWQQHENELAAKNVEAAKVAFAAGEQARAATNARIAAQDREFNAADDLITGTSHYVDPETGTKYDVNIGADKTNAWMGPGGKIVGTAGSGPPPGPPLSWRRLDQIPTQ